MQGRVDELAAFFGERQVLVRPAEDVTGEYRAYCRGDQPDAIFVHVGRVADAADAAYLASHELLHLMAIRKRLGFERGHEEAHCVGFGNDAARVYLSASKSGRPGDWPFHFAVLNRLARSLQP